MKTNDTYKNLLIFFGIFLAITIQIIIMDNSSKNMNEYIQGSQTIEIKNVIYHSHLDKSLGNSKKKEVFIVESADNYYALSFYTRMTKRGAASPGSFITKDGMIYIVINPIELKRHKGTLADPYPVLNYGYSKENFVWDENQYKLNVHTYLAFDFNLSSETYYFGWILTIGILLIVIVIAVNIFLTKKTTIN